MVVENPKHTYSVAESRSSSPQSGLGLIEVLGFRDPCGEKVRVCGVLSGMLEEKPYVDPQTDV